MSPSLATLPAPLDTGFQPAVLFNREYVASAKKSGRAVPLVIGLERENRLVSRYETHVLAGPDEPTLRYVERLVKFLLWARGGWKLYVGGPKSIGDFIRKTYSSTGERKFDNQMMEAAYTKRFQVVVTSAKKVPAARESNTAVGGHLKGCRIGFDLGASDYKVSAVVDGKAVFTEEAPWDPKSHANPEYHYHHVASGLHRAAAHLPRVDAIAATDATGKLWIAITNIDPNQPAEIEAALTGVGAKSAKGETLTAPKVDSVNTFDAPNAVAPKPISAKVEGGKLVVKLEPKSVTVLSVAQNAPAF